MHAGFGEGEKEGARRISSASAILHASWGRKGGKRKEAAGKGDQALSPRVSWGDCRVRTLSATGC